MAGTSRINREIYVRICGRLEVKFLRPTRQDGKRTGTYPNVQFTFLGFTFRPRRALSKHRRLFTGFLPAVSNDALKRMRHAVRRWNIHRRTPATLDELAQQCNTTIQGWWNYYGAFYPTTMLLIYLHIDVRSNDGPDASTRPYRDGSVSVCSGCAR